MLKYFRRLMQYNTNQYFRFCHCLDVFCGSASPWTLSDAMISNQNNALCHQLNALSSAEHALNLYRDYCTV